MKFSNKVLVLIIFFGVVLRVVCYLFIDRWYFGTENFSVNGDSTEYIACILNLIHHGSYTFILNDNNAALARSPGYPFFIGIVYLFTGENIALAKLLLPWIQMVMDAASIVLIFSITQKISNQRAATIAAALYAMYPFAMVWTGVIMSETLTVFLVLLTAWLFVNANTGRNYFFVGVVAALAALTRVQAVFLLAAIVVVVPFRHCERSEAISTMKSEIALRQAQDDTSPRKKAGLAMTFTLVGFVLLYSVWPIRNYVSFGIQQFSNKPYSRYYQDDMIALMKYSATVQPNANNTILQIIKNENVDWPQAAYSIKEDSAKLEYATQQCKQCGASFNQYRINIGTYKDSLANCNSEIAGIFSQLASHQRKQNMFHADVVVPMRRLGKAFFKTGTTERSGINRWLDVVFYYRTLLLIAGIISAIILFRRKNENRVLLSVIFLHFLLTYIFFSFFFYNLEMRYLLYADVLLLIPIAIATDSFRKLKTRN